MSKRPGDPGYAAGWCIHYRSNRVPLGQTIKPEDDTCEAGVRFDTLRGTKFDQRPCFLDKSGESKPDAIPCPHLRKPTPAEIEAHEGWINERMGLLGTVMQGILPWRNAHKGKSASEVVECPACKGRLHLSISGYNGHVHGRCETTGCVSWME